MTDKQRIEIFRAHFEPDATCPCCEELKKCQDECTLEADAPDRYDAMLAARALLKATA